LLGISLDSSNTPFRIYLIIQSLAIVFLFWALIRLDRSHWSVKQRMEFLTNHDSLTSLPNRSLLKERLDGLIPHLKPNNRLAAVLFVGLDGIQEISDTLGQRTSDRILTALSKRLSKNVRHGDLVGRPAEDEFVLGLVDVAPDQDITNLIGKIIGEVSRPLMILDHEFSITASVGVSYYPDDGETADSLLKNSHMAMLQARNRGGNQYQLYESSLKKKTRERLFLDRDLRRALSRDEFRLSYQPQVDIKTGRVVGLEALLRWIHPEQGLVPPSRFIPAAEDSRLIIPIGEWTLRTACRQIKEWENSGFQGIRVAVNLTAQEFQEKNFIRTIRSTLDQAGIEPNQLELELTERTMQDADIVIPKLRELNAMGIELSVDDFGTGYSSLSYLKRFPVHTLKIDKSFIRNLTTRSDDQVIVQVIINLANSLGLTSLAEGVETKEQLVTLRSLGCDRMQGFLYSPPLPADKMGKLLEEKKHRLGRDTVKKSGS
ncbi:MAG TPA: bifunctional diguanylate cyclase/phosphodiesterase, partial [Nitrospiria bacterium]